MKVRNQNTNTFCCCNCWKHLILE